MNGALCRNENSGIQGDVFSDFNTKKFILMLKKVVRYVETKILKLMKQTLIPIRMRMGQWHHYFCAKLNAVGSSHW